MKLLIKNGMVFTESKRSNLDVLIENDTIKKIDENIPEEADCKVIDAKGKFVFPGMIDSHVHYYMETANGRTCDDYITGSKAAVFGGVTTVVDYASPKSEMDFKESIEYRKSEAKGNSYVDYSFHAEILGFKGWDKELLKQVKEEGLNSLKVYTTYGDSQLNYEQLEALMADAKELGLVVTVHAEDNDICVNLAKEFKVTGKTDCNFHGKSRPKEAEIIAIEKCIESAKKTGARLHIVHVSTKEGAELIAKAKEEGVAITCETCPHYLMLTEEKYEGEDGAAYIMTPPLRTKEDNIVLWENLLSGKINSVVSDHCSFDIDDKLNTKSCFSALPGIPGTETIFPVLFTEIEKRGGKYEDIVRIFSEEPAKLFGLYPKKGCIKEGSDADIIIVDPTKEGTITNENVHTKSRYTTFNGYQKKGEIEVVIRRGEVLIEKGSLIADAPKGEFVPVQ